MVEPAAERTTNDHVRVRWSRTIVHIATMIADTHRHVGPGQPHDALSGGGQEHEYVDQRDNP